MNPAPIPNTLHVWEARRDGRDNLPWYARALIPVGIVVCALTWRREVTR